MNDMSAAPKAPRSRKVSAWRRYYETTACWYADMAINLAEYPIASGYAQTEAERFRDGARELRAGKHPNQISGAWK